MSHTGPSTDFILNPLIKAVHADTETPVSVYLKLREVYSCLLESVEGEEKLARFSYIAIDPVAILKGSVDGDISLQVRDDRFKGLEALIAGERELRKVIDLCLGAFGSSQQVESMVGSSPMITSGAFGYFSYDTMHLVEKIPFPRKPDPSGLPDVFLLFCDKLVVFDNVKRKVFIVVNYLGEEDRNRAEQVIETIRAKMFQPLDPLCIQLRPEKHEEVVSNTVKEDFLKKVLVAKEHIRAGDIFQVQVSQRLKRQLNTGPFDVYRMLRTINPSPYLYYFDMGDFDIVGSSPELLVKVGMDEDGRRIVDTRPIAGTRPRGKTYEEDARIEKELLSDEKELAEHLMLIDLSRNDIGRIAKIGTVETNEKMIIERYSHVMHIVSNVRGELQDSYSPMDAFWACFPAGTLTGAPKVRAMEIIYELEEEKRGLYGGAVGFIDFRGQLETAIAIRTMVVRDNTIYFQAAGGIVADSVPLNEFEETMNKMQAGLRTVDALENFEE
ncbi:anthranilate synthase component I [Prosthecochloris sp. SCSIO W1101]|uniref:anthranilate synthase component I n=1 Tax=Prosthecochloris sp. SCSIO W1101 TaxID=2992242 RepID=UPI00223DD595|nr:anthranilate synthase component I [Prosthecochloris sp. SCSIO W1101]UZJ40522.1 anthranilate synthase component I [Prosthecochloris sp. SCSIO W1101]